MLTRAMIVVGGGSSARFDGDKLLEVVAGSPLVAHTVNAVRDLVDKCVLVSRLDLIEAISGFGLGVDIVPGGNTRTLSEMAGLAALGDEFDLIGIHDAARPLIMADLVEALFAAADTVGGAVPVLEPDTLLVDRRSLRPIERAVTVQTPQVFRGPELFAAYVRSAEVGYDAQDTVEIVNQFGHLEIAAIPGDSSNVKVTYPDDLELVRLRLEDPARSEPR